MRHKWGKKIWIKVFQSIEEESCNKARINVITTNPWAENYEEMWVNKRAL